MLCLLSKRGGCCQVRHGSVQNVEAHLLSNQVKEGLPLLDHQQRLCLLQAHGRTQTSVELEHRCGCQQVSGIVRILQAVVAGQVLHSMLYCSLCVSRTVRIDEGASMREIVMTLL